VNVFVPVDSIVTMLYSSSAGGHMVKVISFAVAILAVGALTGAPPRAQDGTPDSTSADSTTSGVRDPAPPLQPPRLWFSETLLRDRFSTATPNYLSVSLDPSSLGWYRPPTRFEAVLGGAGAAATLGMFVGAVGTTLGWFDEDASWILTGSLAAAGALYGGARYQVEPRLRYRVEWER
jgi:hypothetical protein